jgi:hypothetical protein
VSDLLQRLIGRLIGTGQLSGEAIDFVLSSQSVSISGCYIVALCQSTPAQHPDGGTWNTMTNRVKIDVEYQEM